MSQNLNKSRDPEHTPFEDNRSCVYVVNLRTKFIDLHLTASYDGAQKK